MSVVPEWSYSPDKISLDQHTIALSIADTAGKLLHVHLLSLQDFRCSLYFLGATAERKKVKHE